MNLMRFAAHLKVVQLAAQGQQPLVSAGVQAQQTVAPAAPQTLNFTWLHAESMDNVIPEIWPITTALCQLHQNFLLQQEQIHQQFMQQYVNLSEYLQTATAETVEVFNQSTEAIADTRSTAVASSKPPLFSRQDLEAMAVGNIAPYFGDWFKPLDQFPRLIRMPGPPILLADRVMAIEGPPGTMQYGTIYTETDVTPDAWYLHRGRMPAGIMIEGGQADLLLASWLGFDFENRSERIYRLLGCELTYYGELPKVGDTLRYDIHIVNHIQHGEICLFFFHYNCTINGELRLQVRNGQAGFFTDTSLASSSGVIWDPATEHCDTLLPFDPPALKCTYSAFSRTQLEKFAEGKVYECFGPGFECTQCHTLTPRIASGNMLMISEITHFDPLGGPWQRGYMRAVQKITPNDWFFTGHFKNDPCMPGTLMFEAGMSVMSCYMTALGFTLDKDGWRFELVDEEYYKLRCRGQITPASDEIVYELYVTSVSAKPFPTIRADLLGTVKGLKAFHGRFGQRLVPDWPLSDYDYNKLMQEYVEPKPVAEFNGFKFGYASLLACAIGKPTHAFGALLQAFDNQRRVPRLPGEPYHFMSRMLSVSEHPGTLQVGVQLECEYDVPADAWYFQQNAAPVMPFCVLMEVALQPCGWLGSYMGSVLTSDTDFMFRNLDGTGVVSRQIMNSAATIRTEVICTNISRSSGMIIESFKVKSFIGEEIVYQMDTVFGFFPPAAFENQPGLPTNEQEMAALNATSDYFADLTREDSAFKTATLNLASGDLLMIERITGLWPQGGKKGLGLVRAEKNITAANWFFKAHFFQDPVQPGSLGIEAMIQLLQFYIVQQNLHKDIVNPQFTPLALDCGLTWKYRGQVTPNNKTVKVLLEITEIIQEVGKLLVKADASLWVDDKKIYEAKNVSMQVQTTTHNNGIAQHCKMTETITNPYKEKS